jgi:hypothetical protein
VCMMLMVCDDRGIDLAERGAGPRRSNRSGAGPGGPADNGDGSSATVSAAASTNAAVVTAMPRESVGGDTVVGEGAAGSASGGGGGVARHGVTFSASSHNPGDRPMVGVRSAATIHTAHYDDSRIGAMQAGRMLGMWCAAACVRVHVHVGMMTVCMCFLYHLRLRRHS